MRVSMFQPFTTVWALAALLWLCMVALPLGAGAITVDNDGAYTTVIEQVCSATPYASYTAATKACTDRGAGWGVAALPTRSTLNAAYAAFGAKRTFVGVQSHYQQGDQNWIWNTGRLDNVPFWIGNASARGFQTPFYYASYPKTTLFNYTPWAAGYPSVPLTAGACAVMDPAHPNALIDSLCTTAAPCVLCEQSLCAIGADCYPPNTASVAPNTYYTYTASPTCQCTCKAGTFGARCQYPFLYDHGPYVSEYRHDCTAPTGDIARARARCAALGPEWVLASYPTDASIAAFHTLIDLPTKDTYVGATRTAAPGDDGPWSYTTGRLAGFLWWVGVADGVPQYQNFSFANGSRYISPLGLTPWALT